MSKLYDGSEILLTPCLQHLCDFTHKPHAGTTYWRATTNYVLIASIRLLPSAGHVVATSDFYLLFMQTNQPSCNVTKVIGFVN